MHYKFLMWYFFCGSLYQKLKIKCSRKLQNHCIITPIPAPRPGCVIHDREAAGLCRSQWSSQAPTLMSPLAQAVGRALGECFLLHYTRIWQCGTPYISHKALLKEKLYTDIQDRLFFSAQEPKILPRTSEFCSQTLQENPKPLRIAHKEGPPLPLKSAHHVYKICLEVRHMYDLIREYPGIWQVRQLHICCERKQFIDWIIFMNCFHNS